MDSTTRRDPSSASSYGLLDRALHRFAFATPRLQVAVADLEDRLFRRELARVELGPPVLITGLPRAGTTILLELLAGCPELASLRYRDMPFVLCPLMWRTLTRRFWRADTPRERAHGDGIVISLDSPEAFEEVVWSAFRRERAAGPTIPPEDRLDDEQLRAFFAAHRRKVVALRAREEPRARRYLAKNNRNLARIPALWDVVPDAFVVVPFRDPVQHAASARRQHLRFLELHAKDPFARRYMRKIGHRDFGQDLAPIDFDGWFGARRTADATELGFWLEYWLASHRHVLRHADHERLILVDIDRLVAVRDLHPLGEALGLTDVDELQAHAARLHAMRSHDVDDRDLPRDLLADAHEIHAALALRAP